MAIKPIRFYNSSVLRRPAKQVGRIDSDVRCIVEDMMETMMHSKGVGLAAPQIGISKQILIVYVGKEYQKAPYVLLNPVVTHHAGTQTGNEGCLSFPELFLPIERPFYAKIKALDMNENIIEVEGEDLLARALLHEIDHLNGKLFIDYFDDKPTLETELCNLKDRVNCLLKISS